MNALQSMNALQFTRQKHTNLESYIGLNMKNGNHL